MRNGAGTYVLPAGQPVVTGTTISSTVHNTLATDLANALTTSIATDGQSVVTANIPFAGYKLTGVGAATVNGDALRFEDKTALIADSATKAGVQAQTYTAFTTAGTTTAYTLTPSPVIGSLVAGQRFRVKFNAANTSTTPTLAINGLAATALKVYDSTGTKQNPAVGALALNMLTDVEYDGTDYVVLDQLPASAQASEKYIYIRNEQASGTQSGNFTSGAWRTSVLNTEVADTGSNATLASNQIALLAGTYRFQAREAGYICGSHKLKFINITDAVDVDLGSSVYADVVGNVQNDAFVRGRFTIASTKTFELQHQCRTTRNTNGFGVAASFGTEIYAEIELWKEL